MRLRRVIESRICATSTALVRNRFDVVDDTIPRLRLFLSHSLTTFLFRLQPPLPPPSPPPRWTDWYGCLFAATDRPTDCERLPFGGGRGSRIRACLTRRWRIARCTTSFATSSCRASAAHTYRSVRRQSFGRSFFLAPLHSCVTLCWIL
jgi:hypothetical protein